MFSLHSEARGFSQQTESKFDKRRNWGGGGSDRVRWQLAPPTWSPAACCRASFHAERGLCSRWGALLISCEPALNINDLTLSRMYNSGSFILIYPTAGRCSLEYLRVNSHYLGSANQPSVTIKACRRWFIKNPVATAPQFTFYSFWNLLL